MTEPISMMPLWADDFDMDLHQLFPELLQEPVVVKAQAVPLWVYASTAEKDGRTVMAHPSTWNGLFGAPYFARPMYTPQKQGEWVRVDGTSYTTSSPCVCVSLWDALRDAWAHSIGLLMNWQVWTGAPAHPRTFERIMYHIRGWDEDKHFATRQREAKQWALRSAERGLWLAACAPEAGKPNA